MSDQIDEFDTLLVALCLTGLSLAVASIGAVLHIPVVLNSSAVVLAFALTAWVVLLIEVMRK